jgi:hypothetical protein
VGDPLAPSVVDADVFVGELGDELEQGLHGDGGKGDHDAADP